ncbi:uncharacterized protein LOC128951577 [Oppia nitens]|uniref:uncharacterized protein LOC128951577 n=1 Tax=Oppia nitens TaxID=1686743 RepID=UPI0023DC9893|nr:uncharacterized protein LOC128951577 [Oppia nitens]
MIYYALFILIQLNHHHHGVIGDDDTYTVKIDPTKQWGQWDGWGTSLAWWANVFGDRDDLADMMFTLKWVNYHNKSVPGLGLNIARYNVGGCSWNTIDNRNGTTTTKHMVESPNIPKFRQMEGYWLDGESEDKPDDYRSWNWTADSRQRQMVGKAMDRGVDQLEMFSNSPMWWMLANLNPSGAGDGGENLRPDSYRKFAIYLATVAKYARDKWNMTFVSVEPFNEATSWGWTSQGSQEACHIGTEAQQQVIRYLRHELDVRELRDVLVAASDDNTYDGALKLWKSFPGDVRQLVARVNVHGYQYAYGQRKELYDLVGTGAGGDGKQLWNTEYGEGDPSGIPLAQNLMLDLFWLHPTAWIYWQTFDGSDWGLIVTNPAEKQLGRLNHKYYVLSQFCRHIRKGMQILSTDRLNTVAAYDYQNKRLVIVSLNLDQSSVNITYDLTMFATIKKGTVVNRWTTQPKNDKILYLK